LRGDGAEGRAYARPRGGESTGRYANAMQEIGRASERRGGLGTAHSARRLTYGAKGRAHMDRSWRRSRWPTVDGVCILHAPASSRITLRLVPQPIAQAVGPGVPQGVQAIDVAVGEILFRQPRPSSCSKHPTQIIPMSPYSSVGIFQRSITPSQSSSRRYEP
jgi:hypothetical protein